MLKLGQLEKRVMELLFHEPGITSKQMLEKLFKPIPAFSTLSMTLRMMENKGLITHIKIGNTYFYTIEVETEQYWLKNSSLIPKNTTATLQKK